MGWTQDLRNMERETIKILLEENGYYSNMRADYQNTENKDAIINEIMNCYLESYNAYYSIYTIMDSIEDYIEQCDEVSIIEAINSNDFMIKEY